MTEDDRSPRRSPADRTRSRTWPAIREYVDAGYDHVYLHQVGPDQEGFLEFASATLLPEFAGVGTS